MSSENDDGVVKTYQDKCWETNDQGELVYIGPTELTITFDEPLKLNANDKSPVPSITLHEPTARHLSVLTAAQRTKDDVSASIEFIAVNCGSAPAYVRMMKSRDFYKALEFLGGFTQPEITAARSL